MPALIPRFITPVLAILVAAVPPAAADATPQPPIVGEIETTTAAKEDTLLDLAVQHDLGFIEIVAANPDVDPWLPGEGTEVVLPKRHILPDAPHEGIVINLAEMRLYFYPPDGGVVRTYPVGIGRGGLKTPTGQTHVAGKRTNPVWYPTKEARAEDPSLPRVVKAGPDNPLGDYALDLGWPLYLIHGTNNVWGIGRRVSRGCIRMYPKDIEALFQAANPGLPVTVVDQPIKFTWMAGALWMEAHTTQAQALQLETEDRFDPDPDLQIERRVGQALNGKLVPLDWKLIEQTVAARRGVPVRISEPEPVTRVEQAKR